MGGELVEEVGIITFVVMFTAKEEKGAKDVVKADSDDVKEIVCIKQLDGYCSKKLEKNTKTFSLTMTTEVPLA